MRTFLITALILVATAFSIVAAGPARAQDLNLGLGSTSREEAIQESQKFFNQCIQRPIIDLSETTDQAFCACSASNLQHWLEKPATRTPGMEFFQSPSKELTKPVLLGQIYGPCLYIPVYEITYRDCVTDDDNAWSARTEDELTGLCTCMAAGDEWPERWNKIEEADRRSSPLRMPPRPHSSFVILPAPTRRRCGPGRLPRRARR